MFYVHAKLNIMSKISLKQGYVCVCAHARTHTPYQITSTHVGTKSMQILAVFHINDCTSMLRYLTVLLIGPVCICYCYYHYYFIFQLVVSTMLCLMITTILTLHVVIVITYNTTCSIPPNTSLLTLNYTFCQGYISFTLISLYKMFTTFHSLVVQLMVQHQTQSSSVTHQLAL